MKIIKIFLVMFVLMAGIGSLFADEIHLKNKKVLKGRIIQVTPVQIEYDPVGESVYEVVSRDEVVKIVYPGKKTIYFSKKKYDKIFFNDGTYIKGKITKVTKETVVYYPEGNNEKAFTSRDKIDKIIFSNGKELVWGSGKINDGTANSFYPVNRKKVYTKKWKPFYQTRGFHASIIWLRITGCLPLAMSSVDEESDYYSEHSLQQDEIDHGLYNYGLALNFMLPSIKFKQTSSFNITGIKLGLKTVYNFGSFVQMKTSDSDDSSDDDDENNDTETDYKQLISYRSFGLGPDINIVFTPRSNKIGMVINIFATYERVYSGTLKPAPHLRDEGVSIDEDANFAKVTGSVIRIGAGPHLIINKSFPLTFGANLYYSYARFDFDKQVQIYGSDTIAMSDVGIEFSLGLHF